MISTEEQDDGIVLMVQDDGVGFDVNMPLSNDRSHVGIRGVRERIEKMQSGSVDIKSSKGEGTTVTIKVPYIEPLT